MDSQLFNPYESEKSQKISVDFKRNRGSSKKSGMGAVNAGGAVIIIIFVVLCLTIFGLLSFATSFADKKLADRNLDNMAQYYSADARAEETLAKIYDALYSDGAVEDIAGVTDVDYLVVNAVTVSFETEAGLSRDGKVRAYLKSAVEFYFDDASDAVSYKIKEWRIIQDYSGFDYDVNPMNIWDGNFNW
jgi:hypothetical protein